MLAQAAAGAALDTPSFIIDRSRKFSAAAKRRTPWRLGLAVGCRASRALPVFPEEPVASLRRFPLSFLGDRWRGDIDLGSARVVGDLPLMNVSLRGKTMATLEKVGTMSRKRP
jgi:hypothetical protein